MKALKLKMVIFLYFPAFVLVLSSLYYSGKSYKGLCTKVVDGDTIIVRGERIRLIGIDAPELEQKSFDQKPIGRQSRDFLKTLIEGKWVKVEVTGVGYYGRKLGRIYLKDKDINRMILQNGMAIHSRYSKSELLESDEYLARVLRVGIFKTEGFLRPDRYRKKKALRKRAHI